jgi:hypothetical protein
MEDVKEFVAKGGAEVLGDEPLGVVVVRAADSVV